MFELLKPDERYIIGGHIKRGDNTVLDIAVEAIDTPESISKAMNTVLRAMTNYAPKTAPITIDADQAQTAHLSAKEATSTAGQAADAPGPAMVPPCGHRPGAGPAANAGYSTGASAGQAA